MSKKNGRKTGDPPSASAESGGYDLDWENRVLCSDGNCIGIIGPDGHCKECGKPFEGRLPKGFHQRPSPEKTEPQAARPAEEPADKAPAKAARADSSAEEGAIDDWDNRVLCSDGNCIGVIGSDGRCKECGKPFTSEESD